MSKVMLMNDLNERAGKLAWKMQNRWKRTSQWASLTSGMVTPSLLRDVAGRNIAALRQDHYDQVILPDPNDVHQTLLNRYAKRAVAVAPIVAVPIADAHAVGVDSDASDVFDTDYDSEMFDEDKGIRDIRRYMD
jgi:hypothetical protein